MPTGLTDASRKKKADRKPIPAGGKYLSDFSNFKLISTHSAHAVYICVHHDQATGELTEWFYKQNETNARPAFEGMSASFSNLLDFRGAPAYATYKDNGVRVGVISEGIFEFKSASEDRLAERDLNSDACDRLEISILEDLDERLTALQRERKRLAGVLAEIESQLNTAKAELMQIPAGDDYDADALELREDELELEQKQARKALRQHKKQFVSFYLEIREKYGLSKDNLEGYQIRKGLAKGLVSAILIADDDLHYQNLTKDGKRYDRDMAPWPGVMCTFKGRLTQLRSADISRFLMSVVDYINCPVLVSAKPSYYPTKPSFWLPDQLRKKMKPFFNFSSNVYPVRDTGMYCRLYNKRDFIWHKNATMLRFLLTSSEMYQRLVDYHMFHSEQVKEKVLIDALMELQKIILDWYEKIVPSIKQFQSFVLKDGKNEMEKFVRELELFGQVEFDRSEVERIFCRIQGVVKINIEKGNSQTAPAPVLSVNLPEEKPDTPLVNAEGVEVLNFREIRGRVVKDLDVYGSSYSLWTHYRREAKEITKWCDNNNPDPQDVDATIEATKELRKLLAEKDKKPALESPNGGMHTSLVKFMALLDASVEMTMDACYEEDLLPPISFSLA